MKFLKIALYGIGILLLIMVVGFFAIGLTGDVSIPKTVADDPSLPAIEINGIRLHAEVFGDSNNPMVIVVHGGPGSDYRALLPLKALSDQFYVVFYDQRGAGLSERVSQDQLNIDAYREELHQVIKHYSQGQKTFLIGHSWGAMLGTYYLAKYADAIEGAVFAEPGFLNTSFFIEFYEKTNGLQPKNPSLTMGWNVLKAVIRGQFISEPDQDAGIDYMIEGILNSSPTESPIAGYWCENDARNASLDYWRFGGKSMNLINGLVELYKNEPSSFTFDLTDGLENFRKPVLILTGDCDEIIGPDVQIRQAKLFPNAKVKVINGAGHTMFGEKPVESIAVVREFFESL